MKKVSLWYMSAVIAASAFVFYLTYSKPTSVTQNTNAQTVATPVTVTVDLASQIGTSQYENGVSLVDNSLLYPWGSNNSSAVNGALNLIKQGISFHNIHLMAWGSPDPWPDPNAAEPTVWGTMDRRVQAAVDSGAMPVITLCEAPWWMKGQLQGNGSTKLLTQADEWADIAYSSRVLDNKMDKWLLLVQRTAERYMVAPYNVRYFQVWNEYKGYYNPILNRYDYENSAGVPSGTNAKHGYTYMYNKVYERLKQVARSKGIPEGEIRVGGPYVVMDSFKDKNISHPSTVSGPWGVLDKRPLDSIAYWLQNKTGGEFIVVDGKNKNKDSVQITDQFTSMEKFAAVQNWVRNQPGGASLPLWWAEWYVLPYGTTETPQLKAALGAYATIQVILNRGSTTLLWGGSPQLWSATTSGGGQPTPWYNAYKGFHDHFIKGTALYKTTSSSSDIAVMASRAKTVLVNKSGSKTYTVNLNGTSVSVAPYAVVFANTPGGAQISVTPTRTPTPSSAQQPSPTRTPTATRTPTPPLTTSPTTAACTKKPTGDATCDGIIDITDFEVYRKEFTGILNTLTSDFDGDGTVTIADFEIWRRGYFPT